MIKFSYKLHAKAALNTFKDTTTSATATTRSRGYKYCFIDSSFPSNDTWHV